MRYNKCIRMMPLIFLCAVVACGDADRCTEPTVHAQASRPTAFRLYEDPLNRTPADFVAVYGFSAGSSLGPTDQYHYAITVTRSGSGTIFMKLGFFAEDQISRTEPFSVSVRQLNDLFDLMVEQDIFREYWELLPPEEWPTGGGGWSLQVTADGEFYEAVTFVVDQEAVSPVRSAMRLLVPEALWDELWAWRDAYIASHS
jgi:hypothetical protein